MKKSYKIPLHKEASLRAMKKIQSWFKATFGVELRKSQCLEFAIHSTSESPKRLISVVHRKYGLGMLDTMNARVSKEMYERFNSLHTSFIVSGKISRSDAATAILIACSIGLPTPTKTPLKVERDRFNKDALIILDIPHQV